MSHLGPEPPWRLTQSCSVAGDARGGEEPQSIESGEWLRSFPAGCGEGCRCVKGCVASPAGVLC